MGMVSFKSLLKISNTHPTFTNNVHNYLGKSGTTEVIREAIAHYATQSWELFMLKHRDVNLGRLFDNSNLSIDKPSHLYVNVSVVGVFFSNVCT